MRRIFYDKTNGEIILEVQPQSESNVKTVEQDILTYSSLSERNRDMFDVIEVPSETHTQDFAECNGYRVNVTDGTLEFSYPDPNEPEAPQIFEKALTEQVKELKNQLLTADERYKSLDKTTVSLANLKVAKIEQLSYFCEQDILNGFTSTLNGHRYRTNRDDQTNLLGKFNQLMNDTTITTVMWKTEDIGYISHTRENWLSIYYEALTNKETKLFKYDQLKQTVNAKTTNADVDAIVW